MNRGVSRPRAGKRRQTGFTLVEVLAAFVLFSLLFGTVMQTIAGGLRAVSLARAYDQARILAESKLATVGIDIPLQPLHREGSTAGYAWRLEIRPYSEGAASSTGADGQTAVHRGVMHLRVEVEWGTPARTLTLETLRRTRAAPAPKGLTR